VNFCDATETQRNGTLRVVGMVVGEIMSSLPLPRSVRRVLEAMRADAGRDWRLAELADVAGVSGRTLQRQFLSFVGKSPRSVLRDIGFERARRDLLRAAPGTRITDVALARGFPHCGRFSVEYRRRYGETPSQTLKRQARFAAAAAAVLPFCTSSRGQPTIAFAGILGGADQEQADDITHELAMALTRSGVSVTPHPARYRLTGALHGAGGEGHLLFRLLDSETGRQLWAHRCESVLGDKTVPDEHFATRIVAALQPHLRHAEIDRVRLKAVGDLCAHDLALKAMAGVISLDADGNARALALLADAMERDPDHALATALASWAHVQRIVYHFSTDPRADRARSLKLARRAQSLGGDATVLAVLGNALTLLDELEAADAVIRKALAVDGGSVWGWSRSGWIDVYRGAPDAAIERFKIALDLAPHDALAFNSMVGIGCACFYAGRYVEAASWQARALIEHPSATWVHRTLCPTYVLGGAKQQARQSLLALRQRYPGLTLAEVQVGMPPLPRQYRELVVEGLHDAGLPD
jgi:AraC-like DNA-binding protein/tetratricopeptide (TPR) repeat protein